MKNNLIKTKDVVKKILIVFLIMLTAFMAVSMPTSFISYADDNSGNSLDTTDPLTDLRSDSEFNILDYPFYKNGALELKFFNEYCYSFYTEMQDNFALYVYIYNPQALEILDSPLNKIQMAVGYDAKGNPNDYEKFELKLCSFSSEYDYYRLFYKFKVVDHLTNGLSIYDRLNSNERRYDVSGVELVTPNALNATDKGVSKTYYYTGYAKGYGPNFEAPESTLKHRTARLETLQLKPHATAYRPEGTNGKNDYTQDSLHSVYFAVPNEFVGEYGEMVAVHATWLNAVLAPALVTGNQDAWNIFSQYLGIPNAEYNLDVDYMYVGADVVETIEGFKTYHQYGYLFNLILTADTAHTFALEHRHHGDEIDTLYFLYNSGSEVDSADNFVVSSEVIQGRLQESAEKYGGNLINGKYSENMFESVDSEFTEVTITTDDTFSLTSEHKVINQNWWEKLHGISGELVTEFSKTFDGIQAIYPVKDEDILGTPEEVSDRLYISPADVEDFKNFYKSNKDSTIYLFRYQVSDYISQEASLYVYNAGLFGDTIDKVDTNAYFFQETINLDFDIIDVTFQIGEDINVIPVVSDPIDVIPDADPPVHTNSDRIISKFLAWLVFILLIIVTIFVIKWTIKLFTDFSSHKLAVKILIIIAAVLLALLYVMVLIWGVKQIVNFGGLF